MIFVKIFLRSINNHKIKLIIILFLYLLIAASIEEYPKNIVINNSLEYQKDDVYGISNDFANNGETIVKTKFKGFGEITTFSVGEFSYITENTYLSGLARIEFVEQLDIKIALNEIYLRNSNNSLIVNGLQFNNTITEIFSDFNFPYNAIISVPVSYLNNFTTLYLGLNINSEIIYDEDQLNEKINDFKASAEFYFDGNFYWEDVYTANIEQLSAGIEKLQIQIFIIALFVFISLMATLLFLQISVQDEFTLPYHILSVRGMESKTLSKYFVSYFSLINLIISVIALLILSYFTEFNLITGITIVILSFITSLFTSMLIVRNNHVEDNDIFQYNSSISVTEITLLILSIISFMINIFINIPSFKIVKYLLILTIYVSVGFMISFVLYKISSLINRSRSNKPGILSMFIKIDLRIDRNKIIRKIIIGTMIMSIISHQYTVSSINQIDNMNNPYGDVWASYDGGIPDNFSIDGEYSVSYPTTINFQVNVYEGLVIVDDSLFKIHNQFSDSKVSKYPELWVRDGLELSKYIEYLSVISIGENISFTEVIKISNTFDAFVQLPTDPDFILFLDPSYLNEYSETIYFIFRTMSTIAELQSNVEDQLEHPIKWIVPNTISIIDFSLYQFNQINKWVNPIYTLIFALFIVFILGFIDIRLIYDEEFNLMKIKGMMTEELNKIGMSVYMVLIIPRTVVNVLGLILISTSIGLFQLISNIPQLNIIEVAMYGVIYAIVYFIGQYSSWILKSR